MAGPDSVTFIQLLDRGDTVDHQSDRFENCLARLVKWGGNCVSDVRLSCDTSDTLILKVRGWTP